MDVSGEVVGDKKSQESKLATDDKDQELKPIIEAVWGCEDSAHQIAGRIDAQLVQAEVSKVLEAVRHLDVDGGENDVLVFLLHSNNLEVFEKFIAIVEPRIQAALQAGVEVRPIDKAMFDDVVEKAARLRVLCEQGRQNPNFKPVIDAREEVRNMVTAILAGEQALKLLVEGSPINYGEVLAAVPSTSRAYLAEYFRKKAADCWKSGESGGTENGQAEAGSEAVPTCSDVEKLKNMASVLNVIVVHINFTGGDLVARNIFRFLEALNGGDFVKAGECLNRFFGQFQVGAAEAYDEMAKVEEELLLKIEAYLAKPKPNKYKGLRGMIFGESSEYSAWFTEAMLLMLEVQGSRSVRTTVKTPDIKGFGNRDALRLFKPYVEEGAGIYRRMAEAYRIMARDGKDSALCRYLSGKKYEQIAGILSKGLEVKDESVVGGINDGEVGDGSAVESEGAGVVDDEFINSVGGTDRGPTEEDIERAKESARLRGVVDSGQGVRWDLAVMGLCARFIDKFGKSEDGRWSSEQNILYSEIIDQTDRDVFKNCDMSHEKIQEWEARIDALWAASRTDRGPTEEDVERAKEICRLRGVVDSGKGVRWNDAVDRLVDRFIAKFGRFEDGRWSEQQKALYFAISDLTDRDGIVSYDMSHEKIAEWEAEIDGLENRLGEKGDELTAHEERVRQERKLRGIVDRGEGVRWKVAVGNLCSLFISKFGKPSPGQWSREQESLFRDIVIQHHDDIMAAYDMSHEKIAEWEARIDALGAARNGVVG